MPPKVAVPAGTVLAVIITLGLLSIKGNTNIAKISK